jgi:hypothetical protein
VGLEQIRRSRRKVLPVRLFGVWLLAVWCGLVGALPVLAATDPPVPTFHAVPCPRGIVPDTLVVSWRVMRAAGGTPYRDSVTIRGVGRVRHMYRVACGEPLVTYSPRRTTVRACGAARFDERDHLGFLVRGRPIVRFTERVEGCTTLTLDGHARLGWSQDDLVGALPAALVRRIRGTS